MSLGEKLKYFDSLIEDIGMFSILCNAEKKKFGLSLTALEYLTKKSEASVEAHKDGISKKNSGFIIAWV